MIQEKCFEVKSLRNANTILIFHFCFYAATPSFIEAPSDIKVNEGDTAKLPCRAQGRPTTRIIWDRVGSSLVNQLQHISEEVSQYLEEDAQEEMLAKAKIMSLRSKRADLKASMHDRQKRQTIVHRKHNDIDRVPDLYINDNANSRNKRGEESNNIVVSEFKQIMRDEKQVTFDVNFRRKREANTNIDDEDDDDSVDDIIRGVAGEAERSNNSPDTIPILYFSTQPPQEASRLEVDESGELILRDVTKRDQVNKTNASIYIGHN